MNIYNELKTITPLKDITLYNLYSARNIIFAADIETTPEGDISLIQIKTFKSFINRMLIKKPNLKKIGLYNSDKLLISWTFINVEDFFKFLDQCNYDINLYFFNGAKFDMWFFIDHLLTNFWNKNKDFFKLLRTLEFNSAYDFIKEDFYLEKRYKMWLETQPKDPENIKEFCSFLFKNLPGDMKIIVDDKKRILNTRIINNSTNCNNPNKYTSIQFSDMILLMPNISIRQIGEMITETYDINFKKGDYDYNKIKLFNNYNEIDTELLEYLHKDTEILLYACLIYAHLIPRNKWKLTLASTAKNIWCEINGKKMLEKKIKANNRLYKWNNDTKIIMKKINKKWKPANYVNEYINYLKILFNIKKWNKIYNNQLKNDTIYKRHISKNDEYDPTNAGKFLNDHYYGGLVHINEEYKTNIKKYKPIKTFGADISSSYPGQMLKSILIGANFYTKDEIKLVDKGKPFGDFTLKNDKTTVFKGKDYQLRFFECFALTDIINENGLPFISGAYNNTCYKKIKKNTTFQINSYDYINFKKYYKGIYTLKPAFIFNTTNNLTLNDLFSDYVNKFYDLKLKYKAENNLVLTKIAKDYLNNLYGKFGQKPLRWTQFFNIDFELTKEATPITTELPPQIAALITTSARIDLVDCVGNDYDCFEYCDTDSTTWNSKKMLKKYGVNDYNKILKLKNIKNAIDYKGINQCGTWELENIDWYFLGRRAKQYIKYNKETDKLKFVVAGLQYNNKTFTEFKNDIGIKGFLYGATIQNQTKKTLTNNGTKWIVKLEPVEKKIKPIWDFIDTKKLNHDIINKN